MDRDRAGGQTNQPLVANESEAARQNSANLGSVGASDGITPSLREVDGSITYPDRPVGTQIDSVGTLPPAAASPVTGAQPPAGGGPGPAAGGLVPPYAGGFVTPSISNSPGRGFGGGGGARTPTSAQGRAGASGSATGQRAAQGSGGSMGRTGAMGQGAARGGATPAGQSPMGRGVTGGTPRAGGAPGGRAGAVGAPGAGRGNGIVGGRPAAGTASGPAGSRMPRGTVVGGEGVSGSRTSGGRISQRGIVGAPSSTPGTPTGRTSAANSGRGGFTTGGTGLVRGSTEGRRSPEEQEGEDSQRPDYLVEDEETHLPNRQRRDVPPVID